MKRIFAVLTLFLLSVMAHAQAPAPADTLNQADKAYDEKSYGRALDLYRAAKAAGPVREAEKVNYRIAVSLFKTEKWDEAIDSTTTALKTASWKARFYYLLGQIYYKVPHQGWKLGDQIWRQDEYPTVKGDQKPQRVGFYQEDLKATLDNFETAKVEAQRERDLARRARFFAPIYSLGWDEENDLDFDLAAFLPQDQFDEFLASLKNRKEDKFDEVIDPKAPYSRAWSLPKKVLTLYAEIRTLDQADDKADTARSLLAEGLFIRAYKQRMESWANQYDPETKKYVKRPYPFNEAGTMSSWNQLADDLPKSPLAPRALLLVAQEWQSKTALVKAVAVYRDLIRRFPDSKLVSDARSAIADIEAKTLTFNLAEPTRPDKQPKLNVYSRNIKEVQFVAYRIKLEDFLTRKDNLSEPNTDFTEFSENFGTIADATKKFGAPVAKWTYQSGDKSDYQDKNGQTSAPFTQIGAYAVVASGNGTRFAQLVVISDLALLKKSDKTGSFVFVADAKSGQAINGANVVLKETWGYNPRKVDVAQGKSDDGGFFDKKRAGDNDSQVAALAWVGNRYAMTGTQGADWWGDNERNETRLLGTTDRPVYRPGQKVDFRFIVTKRGEGGDWNPLVAKSLILRANNAKGEKFYETKLTTSEFGSVNGEFIVPGDAPLGVFNLTLGDDDQIGGNAQFRVEEYKRPEFEVSITAPKEARRPGETVAARINAKYYFGAPVPNAKVKYTVRKSTWWAGYHFPTPYDWLYSSWGAGDYDTGRRNIGGEGSGKIVKEGEVTTDAQGFAELSFTTDDLEPAAPNDWWARYSNPLYTIEAEVTDQSRRTIEAQGEVKVARQPYFAFLDTQRGYFQQGDRVPIELRTQDANEQSVAASGKMVIYKLLPGDEEEKVFEEAITTDATGRAFWNWEAKDSGQFRVEYQAKGEWGDEIKAQIEIYVVGQNMSAIRLRGVTILLDKKSYEQGDTLKAALVADVPGANVLLTQEASGTILRRDVIKIEGKSRQIEIPIEKKHVPNFFLAAALVQDFEVYQAQTEVFVPPTRQLLNLEVKGDKATYKPGETGTFEVTARDWSGKPARAEVSLALVDASLFYIQKDFTPEVRSFFYGDRRVNSVNLDSSRSGNPQARSENDEKRPNYETHGFDLPDDFGQLQLMPGGFSYYPMQYQFASRRAGGGARSMMADGIAVNGAVVAAAPMPATAVPMQMGAKTAAREMAGDSAASAPGAAPAPVQVRSNFAETAYWSPAVITEGGKATVKVTFPDSLTQWHAGALGTTNTVQVGAAETNVATKKDLLVRLQAPRFFVERDKVVISANVHNYTDKAQNVAVSLTATDQLKLSDTGASNGEKALSGSQSVTIQPNAEKRVDWEINTVAEGEAAIQVTAKTATDSDAVRMTFPVVVHGAPRFAAQSGVLKGDGTAKVALNFPRERKFGASQLNVQLNPSLAATMLDALPYLSDYPYGCVEQTMSRFLPTVITERTLRDSGVNLETLRARAKAYAAESKTENVGTRVKNTGYSFPKGQPNSRDFTEMASQLWFRGRSHNPIFDAAEVRKMTDEGLKRLYSMQRSDGGWGWWPGASQSDEYMSAYVLYGLYNAKNAGVAVRGDVLNRAANYVASQIKDEDNLHLLTYLVYARSRGGDLPKDARTLAAGRLYEQRDRLNAYSKSLLAMTLFTIGEKDKAGVLVRNLENTVQVDAANGTARYKTASAYWYWWNNDVETVAFALRAFLTVEPDNKLVPLLTKWLTLQARGNHFRSTKETAEVVYTLAQYVTQNKELDVDYTLKVNLNDKLARTYHVTRDNALFFDNRFITGDLFLENGANTLTIEKIGKGSLYWSAYSEYFSLEEPIKASGNELEVSRKFYKLTRKVEPAVAEKPSVTTVNPDGTKTVVLPRTMPAPPQDTDQPEYTRTEIKDGETVKSGDLIEVELVVNAKNDYEYLLFEDMKAAGFEPVDVRSGYQYEEGISSYVEMRDEKVNFFVDRLPQGRRVLRYRVRAEVPGAFHALPTNGYAMYAPEVRAISDEMRVSIKD